MQQEALVSRGFEDLGKVGEEDWRSRRKDVRAEPGAAKLRASSPRALFLPALVFSGIANGSPGVATGLLLVDIGLTFGSPVGVTGRLMSAASLITVIVALAMGVLSIRFQHKLLLLAGLASLGISALGCGLAPSLELMILSYSLAGVGMGTIQAMSRTLVGEHFSVEKRPGAVGWLTASGAISYTVGPPVIVFIAGLGGWHSVFLAYLLPISLFALLVAGTGVASPPHSGRTSTNGRDYLGAFAGALSNRSAASCLLGTVFMMTLFGGFLAYYASFYRQRFMLSAGVVSALSMVISTIFVLGSLAVGQLVKRVGRKTLTVVPGLAGGLFGAAFLNSPSLPLSVMLDCLFVASMGLAISSSVSLTIEQVPRFRSTVMSLSAAASAVGSTLGSSLGGLALLQFKYEGMGIILGVVGVVAALIFQFLAIDPTRPGTRT